LTRFFCIYTSCLTSNLLHTLAQFENLGELVKNTIFVA
jgi:hypothetical protein